MLNFDKQLALWAATDFIFMYAYGQIVQWSIVWLLSGNTMPAAAAAAAAAY